MTKPFSSNDSTNNVETEINNKGIYVIVDEFIFPLECLNI